MREVKVEFEPSGEPRRKGLRFGEKVLGSPETFGDAFKHFYTLEGKQDESVEHKTTYTYIWHHAPKP